LVNYGNQKVVVHNCEASYIGAPKTSEPKAAGAFLVECSILP